MISIEPTYIPHNITNFPGVKHFLAARNAAAAAAATAWTDTQSTLTLTPSIAVSTNDGKYVEFGTGTTFTVGGAGIASLAGKYPCILLQGMAAITNLSVQIGNNAGADSYLETGIKVSTNNTGIYFGSGPTNYAEEAVVTVAADTASAMIVADLGGGVIEQWSCTGAGGIAVQQTLVTSSPAAPVWTTMTQTFALNVPNPATNNVLYGSILVGAFTTPLARAQLQYAVQFAKNNPGIIPNNFYGLT